MVRNYSLAATLMVGSRRAGMGFRALVLVLLVSVFLRTTASGQIADVPVHGLWVWQTPSVLKAPHGAMQLQKFCQSQGINEVYVSVSAKNGVTLEHLGEESELVDLIVRLHGSGIRVEALLSSADADEPGKRRENFLGGCGRLCNSMRGIRRAGLTGCISILNRSKGRRTKVREI